jgi:uncharacterized protein (TIGR03435 family)
MADLARNLRQDAGRLVIDKTGLNEVFDIDLKFLRETVFSSLPTGGAPPPLPLPGTTSPTTPPTGTVGSAPPLRNALEEQLGLKLEPAKMPIEVLVIERVEKPSEN